MQLSRHVSSIAEWSRREPGSGMISWSSLNEAGLLLGCCVDRQGIHMSSVSEGFVWHGIKISAGTIFSEPFCETSIGNANQSGSKISHPNTRGINTE
jgi:hypothetical protein